MIASWLFPERCPVCGQPTLPKGALLHEACRKKLPYIREPFCMGCGKPLSGEDGEYCEECLEREETAEGRCLFLFEGGIRRALLSVKENGTKEYVRFFGEELASRYRLYLDGIRPQAIVPVPLHPSARRQRGFNQAELLAKELSGNTGIPVVSLLKKDKRTKAQKTLNRQQRKYNLNRAFRLADGVTREEVKRLHTVLLIDDVYTTGSTVAACAAVLREAGVKRVCFLCVCAGGT